MEFKSKPMRDIHIRPTANGGFLVAVGCAQFAYTVEENLISDLADYIRDPKGVEEEYNKHHKAYDEECAPERPRTAGEGRTRSLGSLEPMSEDEEQPQAEATDPAESIESSGY